MATQDEGALLTRSSSSWSPEDDILDLDNLAAISGEESWLISTKELEFACAPEGAAIKAEDNSDIGASPSQQLLSYLSLGSCQLLPATPHLSPLPPLPSIPYSSYIDTPPSLLLLPSLLSLPSLPSESDSPLLLALPHLPPNISELPSDSGLQLSPPLVSRSPHPQVIYATAAALQKVNHLVNCPLIFHPTLPPSEPSVHFLYILVVEHTPIQCPQ